MSDRGYVLSTFYYVRAVAPGTRPCDYPNLYSRTVLLDSAAGIPSVGWPENALAWRNLYADPEQAEVGTKVIVERAGARHPTVYFMKSQPLPSLIITLSVQSELDVNRLQSVTVAGYPAQLHEDDRCRLLVQLRVSSSCGT